MDKSKVKNGSGNWQARADELPPHSVEAEQGVLGCALLDPPAVLDQLAEVQPEAFYDLRHRDLYRCLRSMRDEGQAIDVITLQQRMKDDGKLTHEDRIYLSTLPDTTPSAANLDHYLGILREKHERRNLMGLAMRLAAKSQDESVSIGELRVWLDRAARDVPTVEAKRPTMAEALRRLQNDIEEAQENRGRLRGKATGWRDFDQRIGGLRAGQLCVVAARPGVGKTALVMNLAERFAVKRKEPVLVFSLEMTLDELLNRASCSLAEVDLTRVDRGELRHGDYPSLAKAHSLLARAPLTILDSPKVTLPVLLAQARRQRPAPALVVVDYLQLVRTREGPVDNTNDELTETSNALKMLAKELDCPVVVTSQLNRDCERHDREPILSDLRGSGAIEQAADWVLLLHRPKDADRDEPEMQCILAKQRSGPTGRFKLVFERRFTRFVDIKGKGDE